MSLRLVVNIFSAAALAILLSGCAGPGGQDRSLPQLSAATGATLGSCTELAARISFPDTTITGADAIPAGALTVAGTPVPAHCQITGQMNERVSPVDGDTYAIRFEMRLPVNWNGRFFYQANGGIDGRVVTATGGVNGGHGLSSALSMGFAVISSDGGHVGSRGPLFGIDPQARLDYGYQAVAALTPMAKSVIQTAYGKGPDRSYFGGCSNGGRLTMVAMSRYANEYDGFLVGDPGFRLPLAAAANIAAYQGYASVATDPKDVSTGFTATEQKLVGRAVLAKCDALDGAADGLVQDTRACQAAFDLNRDVPTCSGARNGTCLSAAQKAVIFKRFSGETDSHGTAFYSSWPFDAGIGLGNTEFWYFTSPPKLDAGALAFIWEVPPEKPAGFAGSTFALTTSIDSILAKIRATNATYTESALSFMSPPNPSDLSVLKQRGAKVMIYHGTSDPIFSFNDTVAWYESLAVANHGNASNFARLYAVPGMTHCSGGPSTDQFDMLTPLVNWVERGQAPESVLATARGPGNPAGVNKDVPASWSPTRTRPLCAYPKVARYKGSGSLEAADSFSCQ
ncbi:MAG TPA: tannase/feruloyl esterase family alpha/beta hydrolase [Rhodanobacter sp.]|nr:MAG: tannase/feruloyl esterase family alpha/beta hydrolase [Candidimonas sp.]TBR76326.1 MAG: tannase/feruloyl esterase family alpha/beta hydrolase [Burkholderiaceae bacterium]HWU76079.1 tannase/feruloyl esterase family alpha/beta hydrolase [Rhodanobacter sp.]